MRAIQAITYENLATPPSPEVYSGSLSLLGLIASHRISIIREQTTMQVKTLNMPCFL